MSRFVVKIKKSTRLDLQAVSLTIGTHSSCDLVLADPVAAQRHCRIAFRGDRYRIEDLGTSTGTFVNGLPAGESSLSDGDEIVVGVSRLTTSIVEEGPTLTLQLQPNSFHFVKSRSGEYHSDPDRWVRTEVACGVHRHAVLATDRTCRIDQHHRGCPFLTFLEVRPGTAKPG